jgi:hypothetical protein
MEVAPASADVRLTVRNLPELHDGHHYSIWASFYQFNRPSLTHGPQHEGGYVRLGDFIVGPDGRTMHDPSGSAARFRVPDGEYPHLLDDVILTIEAPHDSGHGMEEEPGPVLLGGKLAGTSEEANANLSMDYADAFGTDFAAAEGVYSLVAPSAGAADSNAGVWFVSSPSTGAPGLRGLPRAPEGWTYEGWVIRSPGEAPPVYFSTGQFPRADSMDSDGPGPGNPPGGGFVAPGQDFIAGVLQRPDLTSPEYAFMITLEPVNDDPGHPFPLVLLSSEALPAAPPEQRTRPLENTTARSIPSAAMTVRR